MRPFALALLLIPAALGCGPPDPAARAVRSIFRGTVGRPPGPAEKMRRNLQQAGVDDVQYPLAARVRYARSHGLPEPTR